MALVSSDDVQERMARTLTGPEQDAADAMAADFQAELESYLGRTLEAVVTTEERFLPDQSYQLALVNTPVIAITSVTVAGTPIDATAYAREQGGIIFLTEFPRDILKATGATTVVVVYTAGLSPTRAAPAKSIITARTVRALNRRRDEAEGASSLGVEDYKAAYEAEGFTDAELKAVSRLRRRVIV